MHRHDPTGRTTQRATACAGSLQPRQKNACVVVILGEGLGSRLDLGDDPVVVGRSPEADLCISHPSVSRRHCEFSRAARGYQVRDLNSTNRTRVNDKVVECALLKDGDHVAVGETILKFVGNASPEANYHEEVYQLATHDGLTGLKNRRHFLELADKELARSLRHERPVVLAMLDVDHFKSVNDRFGHVAGDAVLCQLSEILRKHVRAADHAARIGGEEFAVLLPETTLQQALSFADRVRKAVAAHEFKSDGPLGQVTISMGLAAMSPQCRTRADLMHAADAALYRAKRAGRNRIDVEG